jgi:uncharacterized protein (TIGR02466 family)
MNIESIFSTFLASDFISVDNDRLENFCREVNTSESKNLITYAEMQELIKIVETKVNEVFYTTGFSKQQELEISACWRNINNGVYIDEPHMHNFSFLSAVYYVKADVMENTGNLELLSPVSSIRHVVQPEIVENYNSYNSEMWSIRPMTGKLVIFPSWIMHHVKQNNSSTDRISIAFDTRIKNYIPRNSVI